MVVFFDSNVIIDAMSDREGAVMDERRLLLSAVEGAFVGTIASKQITDIYYCLRKYVPEEERRRGFLDVLLHGLNVAFVDRDDLLKAMELGLQDYEDAVIAIVAKRMKADFIVTNNGKDFLGCGVPVKTPAEAAKELGIE